MPRRAATEVHALIADVLAACRRAWTVAAAFSLAINLLLLSVPQVQMATRLAGSGPASAALSLTILSANFYGLAGFFAWQVRDWRRAAIRSSGGTTATT